VEAPAIFKESIPMNWRKKKTISAGYKTNDAGGATDSLGEEMTNDQETTGSQREGMKNAQKINGV
jgi:hypothetical protein